MIVALAGRRIDARGARVARFPLGNVPLVRERIRLALLDLDARTVVCSAAAGADLLALEVASTLGLRRFVVLPYARERFRQHSVIDRPGDWEASFLRVCREQRELGGLRTLRMRGTFHESSRRASRVILDDAQALGAYGTHGVGRGLVQGAQEERVTAVVVWDGTVRGASDLTADFAAEARRRGLPVVEVPTV